MPKKVDRQARRTAIADALMRVAATQGLQAVSLRHVAAEAGVSAGMVQHYFRTKDEMMTFALQVVRENVQARLASLPADLDNLALVRALLMQMLPLDEPRWLEGHVGLAFHARSAIQPGLADQLRADNETLRAFLAEQVRAAQRTGGAPTTPDPTDAATSLIAMVEGLSMQVLTRYYPPDTARAALESHLHSLFGSAAFDRAHASPEGTALDAGTSSH